MEVEEAQTQVCKFQRVSSNGSTTSTENSSKIATHRGNLELADDRGGVDAVVGGGGGAGGVARLCGWPTSRIVRVSRASGGKDRHSKVLTSKGLRDRRVRLSVSTAIQFYDLQDRLGYDQPSKAVEWLLKAAASSIDELPSLDPPFHGAIEEMSRGRIEYEPKINRSSSNNNNNNDDDVFLVKSPACSSTSETSKGSGLSLSRSENRLRARERARELASKKEKEKEKEIDSTRVRVLNPVNVGNLSENSSFTDLLTGGITTNTATASRSPMDYLFTRTPQLSQQLIPMPHSQFNITTGDNHNRNIHPFSFLQDSFVPAVTTAGNETVGGGGSYNLSFGVAAASPGAPGGFSRGTLQSNSPASLLQHHHHLQRFQSSSIDGSAATNLPFFIVPNATVDHFPGGYYGGDGGERRSGHHKEGSKN